MLFACTDLYPQGWYHEQMPCRENAGRAGHSNREDGKWDSPWISAQMSQ